MMIFFFFWIGWSHFRFFFFFFFLNSWLRLEMIGMISSTALMTLRFA